MATSERELFWRALWSRWQLVAAGVVGLGLVSGLAIKSSSHKSAAAADAPADISAEPAAAPARPGAVRVEVVKPRRGGHAKTTTQPASVYAFETADLYSKVSGFLTVQNVDIGDKVKHGQLLAKVDDPELDVEVEQAAAAVAQSQAHVEQMQAQVATAKANHEAALTMIAQADAELERAKAQRSFKEKQYRRIKNLFDLNSVDEKLVDEKEDDMLAARAAEHAAEAAIVAAKARAIASAAQIEQAKADVRDAESKVRVMEAALKKAKVFAEYTKIESPFDGVITKRNFNHGDFVRAAERGGDVPLLSVARTDVMRVVVPIPDAYVPFTDPGDGAKVEVDALPGETFFGKISRIANSEDAQSRTMRAEIDIRNTTGKLCQGMYGKASLTLEAGSNNLAIPSSCLVGKEGAGKGSVYVVRDGKARLVPVEIAADDGLEIEIGKGLQAGDQVVSKYSGSIGDGVPVQITE